MDKMQLAMEGLASEIARAREIDTDEQYVDCVLVAHLENALDALKESNYLLKEYEKLSQVVFKIEKFMNIADLTMLVDRIEDGKVEVLQDNGRFNGDSPFMETTIKIRRL